MMSVKSECVFAPEAGVHELVKSWLLIMCNLGQIHFDNG